MDAIPDVHEAHLTHPAPAVIDLDGLHALVGVLRDRGYCVVGPTRRDDAIVYEEIASADELPAGWTEVQEAATYRLERRDDEARFGYPVGPHSWKRWLLPARVRLWQARRAESGRTEFVEEPPPERPFAFLGVRSCDLHAIAVQDRVFLEGAFVERDYATRRDGAFLIVVNCGTPGGTCFCASMGTGPRAESGFDLALTELVGDRHRFVVEVGTDLGAEVLADLMGQPATAEDVDEALRVTHEAVALMGRSVESFDLRDLLARNVEHPRFAVTAERCLSCGNCTLVCPTCFCTSVDDVNVLHDGAAERWRRWDSCYSQEYSYIHGGSVRPSSRSRYRQWLTHKFGTWVDQFGTSGCIGCGRCITWCPVGIDVTEELAAIRAADGEVDHANN
jgi:sulfhydrogenase subunit beta (sulfur reductase)